jgi:SAM-dependent methyltransferase
MNQTTSISREVTELKSYASKGGPMPHEYASFGKLILNLYNSWSNHEIDKTEIQSIQEALGQTLNSTTMQGSALRKPFGYAGDFLHIDRLYTNYVSYEAPRFDAFWHANDAAQAVRNRKAYFKKLLSKWESRNAKVLNVASGPCRDLLEYIEENGESSLSITCLEHDERAIEYAQNLLKQVDHKFQELSFLKANVLKHQEQENYTLIWSAGLFDYFDDETFVLLLSKLYGWLSTEGELVVGNFSPDNQSRPYMELIGQWFLHHRSKEQLKSLAQKAGISSDNISVDQEPLGVNLFLHITKT